MYAETVKVQCYLEKDVDISMVSDYRDTSHRGINVASGIPDKFHVI